MRARAVPAWGGVAHVFLAVALCLPLVAALAMIGASSAQASSRLDVGVLALVSVAFLAAVVWAALLPPVRQVEVATARALLQHDEASLPDVRAPRSWASRRRGASWLAILVAVGLVVATAILYLIPLGVGLLSFPLAGDGAVTWPGGSTHVHGHWYAVWPVGLGLLALLVCFAVLGATSRLLAALAPRVLGPTLVERVGLAADRDRALARANALARDLHDQLGHTLTAMTVQATAARRMLATDPEAADRALAAVEELGRKAQEDVDGVVRTLRVGAPGGAHPSDEPVDLVQVARALARHSTLEVDLRVPDGLPVESSCADAARAVIREALTNAARHGTGSATLRLWAEGRSACIAVHNPVHRAGRPTPHRAGLSGLHERVLLGDGDLAAGPEGSDSWLLTARLPISLQTPRR